MRPRRSPEIEALLDEVARMKSEIPDYEELERQTGLCAGYLRTLISAKVRKLSKTEPEQKSKPRGRVI